MGDDADVRTEEEARGLAAGSGAVPSGSLPPDRPPGTQAAPWRPPPPVRIRPAAGFAALPPRVWRYAYLAVALVLILGLGVGLAARFGGTTTTAPAGQAAGSSSALRTPGTATPHGTAPQAGGRQLQAPVRALLGLRSLGAKAAPAFTLTDPVTGSRVSLADLRSHAVVLTFANASCDDICPVLATELQRAASLLAQTKVPVTFVTVNTDPLDTAAGRAQIVHQPLLSALPHWRFLTGALSQLDPVWKAYGVSIAVNETTHRVSHNNVLYFISPAGRLRWSAIPFADQQPDGVETLPPAQIARFAEGIARYAGQLASRS